MWSGRFIAGATSGLCLFALDDPQKRRSLALYLLARLGQVRGSSCAFCVLPFLCYPGPLFARVPGTGEGHLLCPLGALCPPLVTLALFVPKLPCSVYKRISK